MDFDDDYLSNLLKNSVENIVKEGSKDDGDIKEQREELIQEINSDIDTLEQLREQKKLLRSIRLRKEELKALEGRRKALEALKKIALDGEKQMDQAFDLLNKNPNNTENDKVLNENKSTIDLFKTSFLIQDDNELFIKKRPANKVILD